MSNRTLADARRALHGDTDASAEALDERAERGRQSRDVRVLLAGEGLPSALVARMSARKSGSSSTGRGKRPSKGLLSDRELLKIEATYEQGITAVAAVEIFASRGVRFSEATFRKYVQQGLLPRSRRIGRKGKHRGSLGLYPAKTVRRINAIRALMEDGYTIEEIANQFVRFTDVIERLEEGVRDVFIAFSGEIDNPRFDNKTRSGLARDVAAARKVADDLLGRLGRIAERVTSRDDETYRPAGGAGADEDLL